MKRPALRFDPDDLRDRAGDTTFERGLDYFRKGRVRITRIDPRGVAATVSGSEDYRVRLTGRGFGADGDCTCPAFEDSGFCKHMVATALAANFADTDGAETPAQALRAHLEAQPKQALVSLLLEQAAADPDLLRRLERAAALANPDPGRAEAALRQEIDTATRRSRLPEYHEVRAWAEGIEETLDAITALAQGPAPESALRLAEHALARVGEALNMIDDSNGHAGGLLVQAAAIHHAACTALRPEPTALARDLFAREMAAGYDAFHGAVHTYAEVLGDTGRAEYRRLAQAAWDEIPPRGPRDRKESTPAGFYRLFSILDGLAEADGDVAARVALRAKDLSAPWSYAQLAGFCRAAGRPAEALARAEEGLWVFEDERNDLRLLALATELLIEAGRPADAEAHLWRAFAATPSLDLYDRLVALGGDPARERAIAALEARLAAAKPDRWSRPADLILAVLVRERRFDRAWAIAATHPPGDGLLDALATATETSHPREALAAHAARVHRLATTGGNLAYTEAAALVARMAALQPPAEHAAFVAALRTRYARRRTFIPMLEAPARPADPAGRGKRGRVR